MGNIFHKIGGYDSEIVKAGRLGTKYIVPGISLGVVLLTSLYGGWHLTRTIINEDLFQAVHNCAYILMWILRVFFLTGYVSLILLVDFIILHGKGKLAFVLRLFIALLLSGMVSVLTCLGIFQSDIAAQRNISINSSTITVVQRDSSTLAKLKENIQELEDSVAKYKFLALSAHKGTYKNESGKPVGACVNQHDMSKCPEGTYCKLFQHSAERFQAKLDTAKNEYTTKKNEIGSSKHAEETRKSVKKQKSTGLIGQIKDLLDLMKKNVVVIVTVCGIFLVLILLDLTPVSLRTSLKKELDADYKIFFESLRGENGESATYYKSYCEKFKNKENEDKDENKFLDAEIARFYWKNDNEITDLILEKSKSDAELERKRAGYKHVEEIKAKHREYRLQEFERSIKEHILEEMKKNKECEEKIAKEKKEEEERKQAIKENKEESLKRFIEDLQPIIYEFKSAKTANEKILDDKLSKGLKSIKEGFISICKEWEKKVIEPVAQEVSFENFIVQCLLPVIDNFERAFDANRPILQKEESDDLSSINDKFNSLYHKLCELLSKNGVEEIKVAIGEPFDTHFHFAVGTSEDKTSQKGKVMGIIQKGYTLKDKVIRYAKVMVGE